MQTKKRDQLSDSIWPQSLDPLMVFGMKRERAYLLEVEDRGEGAREGTARHDRLGRAHLLLAQRSGKKQKDERKDEMGKATWHGQRRWDTSRMSATWDVRYVCFRESLQPTDASNH